MSKFDTIELDNYESVVKNTLNEVRQYIIAYKFKYYFECLDRQKNIRLLKSVYEPKNDIYHFYLDDKDCCYYIKKNLEESTTFKGLFKEIIVDDINEKISCIELIYNDTQTILNNQTHRIKTMAL